MQPYSLPKKNFRGSKATESYQTEEIVKLTRLSTKRLVNFGLVIHRGQIVEKAIYKSGYPITKLAKKLEITCNTLYNKLKDRNLDYRFIRKVGAIIFHDFSIDFPEMKQEFFLID
jgi:hypothetical protein